MPLHSLRKYEEAIGAYTKGVELDPQNSALTQGLAKCQQDLEMSKSGMGGGGMPGGMGGLGNMFGPEGMARCMADPKISQYFKDPQFKNMFEMCKQNPQMLMQFMQMDPRFQDVLSCMLGIDL